MVTWSYLQLWWDTKSIQTHLMLVYSCFGMILVSNVQIDRNFLQSSTTSSPWTAALAENQNQQNVKLKKDSWSLEAFIYFHLDLKGGDSFLPQQEPSSPQQSAVLRRQKGQQESSAIKKTDGGHWVPLKFNHIQRRPLLPFVFYQFVTA